MSFSRLTPNSSCLLLDAQASAAVGAHKARILPAAKSHTVSFSITGGPSAVSIAVNGRLSESDSFAQLGEYVVTAGDLTAGFGVFHIASRPVTEIELEVTVLTGGTTPTVSARYQGVPQ